MKNIILTISLILVLALIYFTHQILLASLIGIGIGVLLMPLFNKMSGKYNFPRGLTLFLIVIFLLIIFSIIIFSLYYLVAGQVDSLSSRLPELEQFATSQLNKLTENFPSIENYTKDFNFKEPLSKSAQYLWEVFKISFAAISGAIFSLIIGLYIYQWENKSIGKF
jgi:predicted PurR-regulated permease PerM